MSEKPRILVVDDEPRSVELMVRMLRPLGQVTTADSADEAWKIFEDGGVDLIVTDQRMPGMQGVELLTRVAECDETVGRVLLTGYTDLGAVVDAINLGRVHAYLRKPCDPDEVLERCQAVLGRMQHVRARERLIAHLEKQRSDGS